MAGTGEQFVPMYFVFVALIIGATTLALVERYTQGRLPYVLILFIEGLLLGYFTNALEDNLGDFSASFILWQGIDPFLLLAVFLPGLLFGDGLETETYQLNRILPQLVLLCLVGTIIMTALLALVAGYLHQGEQWGIYACILFGAILSSPDPVVLINLLETTSNTPEKYILLSGSESHFCDLTVFTLFTVFFGIVTSGTEENFGSGGDTTLFLTFNLLGGPITGFVLGICAYYGIKKSKATEKPVFGLVQITITVCTAYFAFLISEHNLGGNGILATVVASLVLAAYAKSSFVNYAQVESTWKTIEYFAVTIVIFLSGVIAAEVVYKANITDYSILIADIFITYGALMVARFLMIFILFIPMNKVGEFSLKEAVCMSWCNIRGALALTLALAVVRIDTSKEKTAKNLRKFFLGFEVDMNETEETMRFLAEDDETGIPDPILQEQLARFYLIVASVTLMTILINYSLADSVFIRIGLLPGYSKKAANSQTVRGFINRRIEKRYREILHRLTNKNNKDLIDINFLSDSLDYFDREDYEKYGMDEATDGQGHASSKYIGEIKEEELENGAITIDEMLKHADRIELNKMQGVFYRALKQSYWRQIEQGIIPKGSSIALRLLFSANIAADDREKVKSDFEALSLPELDLENGEVITNSYVEPFYVLLDKITCSRFKLQSRFQQAYLREAVYVASCYLDAHADAESKLAGAMGRTAAIDTYEEAIIIKKSKDLTKKAKEFIENAKSINEQVDKVVETLKVGSAMLEGHQNYIKELNEDGLVEAYEVQKEFNLVANQRSIISNQAGFSRKMIKRTATNGASATTNPPTKKILPSASNLESVAEEGKVS